jgi:hypothetical protein
MRRVVATFIAVVVVGGLAGVTLLADTLVLRDGRRVQGELLSVRDGVIEFVEQGTWSSRTLRVSRDDVERIELDDLGRGGSSSLVEPGGARPRGLREREVAVSAVEPWSDTGIDVRDGQTVYFEARGRVRWGPNRRDEAAGEKNSPFNANRPIPRRPAAALIGRVGDSTDCFFIGGDQGPIRIRGRGRLYLGVNDDYLKDNSGAFTVTIYY